jgi:hypothetical protein
MNGAHQARRIPLLHDFQDLKKSGIPKAHCRKERCQMTLAPLRASYSLHILNQHPKSFSCNMNFL